MDKKTKTIEKYFKLFTKGFEVDPAPKVVWIKHENNVQSTQEFRMKLPVNLEVFHPYIVFIIFVHLKQFPYGGRWEKVAWEIPITFKGIPFILTHRKFGFRIMSNVENEEVSKAAIEAMTNIHKAIPYAEKLIEPHIKSLVQNRSITIDNEYRDIQRRYFFKQ